MEKKSGFTTAEILVCITLVGLLYLALMPVVKNIRPVSNKALIKKAYNTVSKVVDEMINNDFLYPDIAVGFDDTVTGNETGYNKFCYYFIKNLNTTSETYSPGESCTAKTSDGLTFTIIESKPASHILETITVTLPNSFTYDILVEYDGKIKVSDANVISILNDPLNSR